MTPKLTPLQAGLIAVDELLADKSRWTRFTFARSKIGLWVDSSSKSAFSFCLQGAVRRCCIVFKTKRTVLSELGRASYVLYGRDPMAVNDKLGYRAVRRVLKIARERAGVPRAKKGRE